MYPDDQPIKVKLPDIPEETLNEPPPEYDNDKNCLIYACVSKNESRKRCIRYSSIIISFLLGFIICFVFAAIFNSVMDSSYVKCEQQINDDPDFYLRVQEEKINQLQKALDDAIRDKQELQGKLNACQKNMSLTRNTFERRFFKKDGRPEWVRVMEINMRKMEESMERDMSREIRRAQDMERRRFRNHIKDFIRSHQRAMDMQTNLVKRLNDALRDSFQHPDRIDQNRRRFCDTFDTLLDKHMLFRVPNPMPMPINRPMPPFPLNLIFN